MRRFVLALSLASLPAAALAQNAVPDARKESAAPAAAKDKPDPARLAAARPVIDKLWPLGTYRKMMDRTLDMMLDGMLAGMFDMKASDIAAMGGAEAKAAEKLGDTSLRELARANDPHFDERMRISMTVMMREMGGLMTAVEPQVREAMSAAYARRFTLAQLGDIDRFFSTPTGRIYASESLMLMTDPEMMKAMQAFTPELMKAMPAIMQKVQAATAHLPPPPKPKPATDAAADDMPTGI